jgi:hypothetical protein
VYINVEHREYTLRERMQGILLRREYRMVPIMLDYQYNIRPIEPPSATNPTRRELRARIRASEKQPLSQMLNPQRKIIIRMLISSPYVYQGTDEIIPPAAIRSNTLRKNQARILGLKRASEAQRAVKAQLLADREASTGTTKGEAREKAVKRFYGNMPPKRGFRFGDIHEPFNHTRKGKCVGHYLWHYDDGTVVHRGIILGNRIALQEQEQESALTRETVTTA